MLELRKEIFADERDDNLKEIGKPTQRQDMIGHVTGNTTYFDDHKLAGLLHLKVLLDRNPSPTRAEIVEAISGNICRCTGYEPIINAVLAAASGGRARA